MLFSEEICITGVRGSRKVAATLNACLVDDGIGDPFSDSASSTECVNVSAFFRFADWSDTTPPQVGDFIFHGDDKFAVKRVSRLGECYCASARKV